MVLPQSHGVRQPKGEEEGGRFVLSQTRGSNPGFLSRTQGSDSRLLPFLASSCLSLVRTHFGHVSSDAGVMVNGPKGFE
jgi:hypothetical protein